MPIHEPTPDIQLPVSTRSVPEVSFSRWGVVKAILIPASSKVAQPPVVIREVLVIWDDEAECALSKAPKHGAPSTTRSVEKRPSGDTAPTDVGRKRAKLDRVQKPPVSTHRRVVVSLAHRWAITNSFLTAPEVAPPPVEIREVLVICDDEAVHGAVAKGPKPGPPSIRDMKDALAAKFECAVCLDVFQTPRV